MTLIKTLLQSCEQSNPSVIFRLSPEEISALSRDIDRTEMLPEESRFLLDVTLPSALGDSCPFLDLVDPMKASGDDTFSREVFFEFDMWRLECLLPLARHVRSYMTTVGLVPSDPSKPKGDLQLLVETMLSYHTPRVLQIGLKQLSGLRPCLLQLAGYLRDSIPSSVALHTILFQLRLLEFRYCEPFVDGASKKEAVQDLVSSFLMLDALLLKRTDITCLDIGVAIRSVALRKCGMVTGLSLNEEYAMNMCCEVMAAISSVMDKANDQDEEVDGKEDEFRKYLKMTVEELMLYSAAFNLLQKQDLFPAFCGKLGEDMRICINTFVNGRVTVSFAYSYAKSGCCTLFCNSPAAWFAQAGDAVQQRVADNERRQECGKNVTWNSRNYTREFYSEEGVDEEHMLAEEGANEELVAACSSLVLD